MCSRNNLRVCGDEGDDNMKHYPIHSTCRNGDIVLLRDLLSSLQCYNDVLVEDKFYGWAPIHWASYFGTLDCLNTLLQFGISVNLCTNRFRQTPSHVAAFGGHPQCLSHLLKSGANFQAKDYLGETPLHKAARVGNAECIKILIQSGAKCSQCNNNGHTPCDLARVQRFGESVKQLEAAGQQEIADNTYLNEALTCNRNHQQLNGITNSFFNGNGLKAVKRLLVDESIPDFSFAKRVKFQELTQNGNGHMDCEMEEELDNEIIQNDQSNGNGEVLNGVKRAPSPGMDMHINNNAIEDMQVWGYENGFGDTAEAMPENYENFNDGKTGGICFRHRPQPEEYMLKYNDRSICDKPRGLQFRGWH